MSWISYNMYKHIREHVYRNMQIEKGTIYTVRPWSYLAIYKLRRTDMFSWMGGSSWHPQRERGHSAHLKPPSPSACMQQAVPIHSIICMKFQTRFFGNFVKSYRGRFPRAAYIGSRQRIQNRHTHIYTCVLNRWVHVESKSPPLSCANTFVPFGNDTLFWTSTTVCATQL